MIPSSEFQRCMELAHPPPPREVLRQGWLEKKGGHSYRDADDVLRKERHYNKGGRRNWKRRYFVMYSTGELDVYGELPEEWLQHQIGVEQPQLPPHEFLKSTVQLVAAGQSCAWQLLDGTSGEYTTVHLTLPGIGPDGDPTIRRVLQLRAEERADIEAWARASIDAVGDGVDLTVKEVAVDDGAGTSSPWELPLRAAAVASHAARSQQWEAESAASLPQRSEQLVGSFPQPGQALLRSLIAFLQRVDPVSTKMTPSNLGMVFALSVMRREDPMESMKNIENDKLFVTLLIEHLPPHVEAAESEDEAPEFDSEHQQAAFKIMSKWSREIRGQPLSREEFLEPETLSRLISGKLPDDTVALLADAAAATAVGSVPGMTSGGDPVIPQELHEVCSQAGLDSICAKLLERFPHEVAAREITHKRFDSPTFQKISDRCTGFDRAAAVLWIETIWLHANDLQCDGECGVQLSEMLCDRLHGLGVFHLALDMDEHANWNSPPEKWRDVCVFANDAVRSDVVRQKALSSASQVLDSLPSDCKARVCAELEFLLKTAAASDENGRIRSALANVFLQGLVTTWFQPQPLDQVMQMVFKEFTGQLLHAYVKNPKAEKQPPQPQPQPQPVRGFMLPTTPFEGSLQPEPEPERTGTPQIASVAKSIVTEWADAYIYAGNFPNVVPPHGFDDDPMYGWNDRPTRTEIQFAPDECAYQRLPDGSLIELALKPLAGSQQEIQPTDGLAVWRSEIQCRCVAQMFAEIFNARCGSLCPPVYFGKPYVLRMHERDVWYCAERQWGYLSALGKSRSARESSAFSHLSYEASAKRLVVEACTSAGESTGKECAVHTCDHLGFGTRNRGRDGMRSFLHGHVCNDLCKAMNLPALPLGEDQIPLPLGWEEADGVPLGWEAWYINHNTGSYSGVDPRFQPGQAVEYLSYTHGNSYLQAQVKQSNLDGTVSLDLRDNAVTCRIRAPAKCTNKRTRLATAQLGGSDPGLMHSSGGAEVEEGVPPDGEYTTVAHAKELAGASMAMQPAVSPAAMATALRDL